jgi:uncharacterized RmlC-like cupin family protein
MIVRARVFPATERRVPGGPATPGMTRTESLAEDGVWLGTVWTDPGVVSGWHHHGDFDTYIYVLRGKARVDTWIDGQIEKQAGRPGDFIHVPRGTVHREGSASASGVEAVLVRIGSGQVVFNVDGVPEDG